jgi:ferredoxin
MDLHPTGNGLESIECIKCLDCIKECKKDAIGIKLRILNCH